MEKTVHKTLPTLPGIYLFKDTAGSVIYIGKAKSLKSRVGSYFQKNQPNWKVSLLLHEYNDLDYILTKNETEALLLEAQLIQQYKPKFNTLFKDGQPFVYIMFTKDDPPRMKIVRNKNEKGTYFGPFLQKGSARSAYRFLMETFKLNLCNKKLENGCLDYHLGYCPGSCMPNFDPREYRFQLELAKDALKNKHRDFIKKIKEKIVEHSTNLAFEKSKRLQNYIDNLDYIFQTIKTHFSEKRYNTDIFVATTPRPYAPDVNEKIDLQLKEFLKLDTPIRTIDCFDISHFQSRYIVGSCVRFTDGKPEKNKFRRFKIKTIEQQNDYAALQEIVARRYTDRKKDKNHRARIIEAKNNPVDLPDLILIDGGKGQLHAVQDILPQARCASLAKREERLYSTQFLDGKLLDITTDVGKLLIALRDYAHHFAISYHRLRRTIIQG